MKTLNLLILFLLLFGAACSPKVPFTNAVKEKYKLTEAEIKSIQFYLSEDIILFKKESQGDRKTEDGELVVSSSTEEDRLIFKKGTPCVVAKVENDNRMAISFETNDKTLNFESTGNTGEYKLVAESWNNGRGKVTYGKDIYYAAQGSGNTYLLFKLKKLNKYKSRDQVIKGRKV